MPHLVATGLTGAALALLPPLPTGLADAPHAALRLTLSHPDGGSGQRTVTLRCDPTGGNHPLASEACAELSRSGGTIGHPPGGACTMIYAPVVAEATGHWYGRPVRYRAEFGNDCALRAGTGSVFRF
jgi:hypothetical protein